jgi:hypothetical protein
MLAAPPLTPVYFKCMYLLQIYRDFHEIWQTKGKLDVENASKVL